MNDNKCNKRSAEMVRLPLDTRICKLGDDTHDEPLNNGAVSPSTSFFSLFGMCLNSPLLILLTRQLFCSLASSKKD